MIAYMWKHGAYYYRVCVCVCVRARGQCRSTLGTWLLQAILSTDFHVIVTCDTCAVTRDARYFVALQYRKDRYGVVTYDASMNISRGTLV